jgi:hypothetical protein
MSKNVVAVAFALSLTCLPAKADIINVTATGSVQGYDYTGVFGYANSPIVTAYSATYVFDTSFGVSNQSSFAHGGTAWGTTTPAVFAALTINGHEEQFGTHYNGDLQTSAVGFYAAVEDGIGNYLLTNIYGGGSTLPSSFLFDPSFSIGPEFSSTGGFTIKNIGKDGEYTAYAYGSFSTEYVSITNVPQDVAPVPGPMVGAGIPGLLALFGMGGLYWRRKQLAG